MMSSGLMMVLCYRICFGDVLADDQFLLFLIRVTDHHLQHETVHLGFGQGIGSFLLDRVFGGQHQEWFRQR